jgi:hypothetical protein
MTFLTIAIFLTYQPFTIKTQHISSPSGTYYPNDEDLSSSEQMGTSKGRFREETNQTSICQCQLRRQRT